MFHSLLITFALSAASPIAEMPEVPSSLVFPSGDTLTGHPLGVDADGHLFWQSELFTEQQGTFFTSAIDSISLDPQMPPADAKGSQAIVTFQSHVDRSIDTLSGELLGFGEEMLTLRTWYGGELSLRRSMLERVTVDSFPTAIIGPSNRSKDWNILGDQDSWVIEKGAFSAKDTGTLARNFPDLPDTVQISFDLKFEGYSPYLRLFFSADSGTSHSPAICYLVNIQRGPMIFSKTLNNRRKSLPNERAGMRPALADVDEKLMSIDLYLNRKEGSMTLYLNGELNCSAVDLEPITEHNWLLFNSTQKREQTIANFSIYPWDGVLPKKKDFLAFREDLPQEGEQIELQNGDTIIGEAQSITDGKLTIETELMPIAIPLSRLLTFQVTSFEDREEPRIYREDVRCYFPDNRFVTLKLAEITPTTISGYSQVFGDATFQLGAFSRIDFNPYDEEARIRRGEPF